MLDRQPREAVAWGERALALSVQFSDEELTIHALNNIGSAEYSVGDDAGRPKLELSLARALRAGFEEHVARAYANLVSFAVDLRDYRLARRYLDQANKYLATRDLDAVSNYLDSWRALLELEQAHWVDAGEHAGKVLAIGDRASPIARVPALAVLGRLRARRGDPGVAALLDQAAALAAESSELQRLLPVIVRGEAAWIAGNSSRDELRAALDVATAHHNRRAGGELAYWLWKQGATTQQSPEAEAPYLLQMSGRWAEAAELWQQAGCPYERALALAEGDDSARREAFRILESLDATATLTALRERLRAAGVRGVPRGPRPTTTANPAGLTKREMDVLLLLAKGLPNAEIARRLVRAEKTVDHHVSSILSKLDVRTRTEAASAAHRLGLIR